MRLILRPRLIARPKPIPHAPVLLSRYFSISSSRPGPFTNRNCLITGGSSGIGRAIAIEFARLGANITVIGRDTERLVQTLDLCDEARGKYKESMLLYSTSSITQDSFWEMLSRGDTSMLKMRGDGNGEIAAADANGDAVKAEDHDADSDAGADSGADANTGANTETEAVADNEASTETEAVVDTNAGAATKAGNLVQTSTDNEESSPADSGLVSSKPQKDDSKSASEAKLKREQPDPNIDILVNCAGVQYDGLLFRQEVGSIKETLQTNLLVPTLAAKYLGRSMVRRAVNMKGTDQTHSVNCIINISSVLAVKGGRGAAAYAASKAGVIGLTRSLAGEFGPLGLRVNAILPGYIRTRMTENMSERASSDAKKKIPLGRFGEPHEIAEAAVFLAQNQYANGCILNLDGGIGAEV